MFSFFASPIKLQKYLVFSFIFLFSFTFQASKPTIFLVGDSTMAEGKNANGGGWGKYFRNHLDTNKVSLINTALSGTSSRSFYTGNSWNKKDAPIGGLWDTVQIKIKKGDFVIIQFGHNDASPISDTTRCRGSLKGTNYDTTTKVINYLTKKEEIVHSFGWYLTQMIRKAKEKGATPILLSYTPRNEWKDGKIIRDKFKHGQWAREIADKEKIQFIDVNEMVAASYEVEPADSLTYKYFNKSSDVVHTSGKGSDKIAALVAQQLKNSKLKSFLK